MYDCFANHTTDCGCGWEEELPSSPKRNHAARRNLVGSEWRARKPKAKLPDGLVMYWGGVRASPAVRLPRAANTGRKRACRASMVTEMARPRIAERGNAGMISAGRSFV
jgi:hypothetical protein